jgi:hypothetical protein
MAENESGVAVSQVNQIGELFSDYAPPVVDGEPKETPKEDLKETPKEEIKETPKETPKEEPKVDEKDTAISTLTDQVKTLVAQVAALSAPKKAEVVKEEVKKEEPVYGMGFFKDKAEYEAAFEKPEVMSEVMGRVANAAVQTVLKTMPQVINNTIKAQMEVQSRVSKFFEGNEDLKTHKEFVGYVSNDLSGKNPDWTLEKLFTELPGEVRKRIGLKAAAVSNTPAQPGKKVGARVPGEKKPELTPIENEIMDLM